MKFMDRISFVNGSKDLTVSQISQLLDVDFKTGKLFWKPRPLELFSNEQSQKTWNTRYAGKEAFTSEDGRGYLRGSIFDRDYRAHRIIWALYHGAWSALQVDHRNGIKTDNRIGNLREATNAQNAWNSKRFSTNQSGYKGVSRSSQPGRWTARISANGRRVNLGCFGTPEDAHAAYCEASQRYHGSFGRVQ